jgi:hypothetical protein
VLAPLAAVFGGSEIAHRGLGTERIFSERHRETMGRGVEQLASGEQGNGDIAEGVGAVAWSVPSVIAGAGGLTGVCMSGLWRIAKRQKTLQFCLRSEGPLVQKRSSIMMSHGSLRPKIYACAPV